MWITSFSSSLLQRPWSCAWKMLEFEHTAVPKLLRLLQHVVATLCRARALQGALIAYLAHLLSRAERALRY
eukprot:4698933-Amphidinium_carterae.1